MDKELGDIYQEPYVVVATAFGHANQIISTPMDEASAKALAEKVKEAMKDLDKDFQIFKNVKVQKYKVEPMNTTSTKGKDDPYNYTILDKLDKIIKDKKWGFRYE